MFRPTPEQVIDIQQRSDDGYPMRDIVAYYQLTDESDYYILYNIAARRRLYKNLPLAPKWRPTCISAEEYYDWLDLHERMTRPEHRPHRPCDDCEVRWAMERRAEGVCNGSLPNEADHREQVA